MATTVLSPKSHKALRARGTIPLRGQVEAQFNWIYVLIAGAVILIVAFSFITKQRNAKNLENADKMLQIIDEITTGAGIREGTAEIIDLPRMDVNLKCTAECTCTINVPPAPAQDFHGKIIFGPEYLSRRVMLWAESWSKPFRSNNFIFIGSPTVQYYIVTRPNSPVGDYIKQRIPAFDDEFSVIFVNSKEEMQTIPHPGTEHVRVVYVDDEADCTQLDSSFAREDYSCVVLNKANAHQFYHKTARRSMEFSVIKVPAVQDAGILAAVFAADGQMYLCNMHMAYDRLGHVAQVYKARTEELEELRLTTSSSCMYSYDAATGGSALGALDAIITASRRLVYELTPADIGIVETNAMILSSETRRADNEGCAPIY